MSIRRLLLCLALLCPLQLTAVPGASEVVAIGDAADRYTLSNGILTATISKRSGGLLSLRFNELDMLDADQKHMAGYWSHAPSGAHLAAAITIDPTTNGGERAEVSIKASCAGKPMGNGPGGSAVSDIEIRYSLGRGEAGLYLYCIFGHQPDYPRTQFGEARFCVKLNDGVFDWMTVDSRRNLRAITTEDWNHGTPLNMKEARRMTTGEHNGQVEHKYDYAVVQFDTPAFGWSSTRQHVGIWLINPTTEYLSGGPTKVELCAHRDATFTTNSHAPAPPCLLNYWRGSHYGSTSCAIDAGEAWTKVVGPFLLYCNRSETGDAMWKDALNVAAGEAMRWPYDWVCGVDYPHRSQRATVSGQIVLDDPRIPGAQLGSLLVGLAAPDYDAWGLRDASHVDWQLDAKYYQFWVRGAQDGHFSIPHVRPGSYTLHAVASAVLGEFARANIVVEEGKPLDLGKLVWTPVRHGRQLWEIGVPDRTAGEFFRGDHYWQWGLYNQYPTDFPNDVNFIIGKSDWHKDWNYAQCPRADRPQGTPWTITFEQPQALRGKATLRVAFAGPSVRRIDVSVNDQPAGTIAPLQDTAVIRRDGIRGYWFERSITFDAAWLKAGTNVLKLTIPPGNPMNGVEYDYLRLELDDR